jgi:hypothetical protein
MAMTRFRLLPVGVEEAYFKPVPEGWVFVASRPWWLFGPRPAFLVTDAQKPAIAARLRRNRYLRAAWLLVAAVLVLWVWWVAPRLVTRDTIFLFAVVWFAAVNICERRSMWPLLAGLPPAPEGFGVTEMVRQQARGMSAKTIAGTAVFFTLAAAYEGYLGATEQQGSDFWSNVALFFGFCALIFYAMLLEKLVRRAR